MFLNQDKEEKISFVSRWTLKEEERISAFKYCGYPLSSEDAIIKTSFRYLQSHAKLSYRLNIMSSVESEKVIRHLNLLCSLEAQLLKDDLGQIITDTTTWTPNIQEIRKKIGLFNECRQRFCAFLEIEPGPIYPRLN